MENNCSPGQFMMAHGKLVWLWKDNPVNKYCSLLTSMTSYTTITIVEELIVTGRPFVGPKHSLIGVGTMGAPGARAPPIIWLDIRSLKTVRFKGFLFVPG